MKIFALATFFLLQGQTALAQDDLSCPANEAVSWKCGKKIYRCAKDTDVEPREPLAACDEGVGNAEEVLLSPHVCKAMQKEAIAIGEDCFHGLLHETHEGFEKIRALSNRICVSDSGDLIKEDAGGPAICGSIEVGAELLSVSATAEEVFAEPEESVVAEAESGGDCCPSGNVIGWKCGTYVYRCADGENHDEPIEVCNKGVGGAKEVIVNSTQCAAMQDLKIGQGCVVDGFHTHALSNRVCIVGNQIMKFDGGDCGSCGTTTAKLELPVEEPVDEDPVVVVDPFREPVAQETPEEPAPEEQQTEPPATRAPAPIEPEEAACPGDIVLLETDGTAQFPNGAIQIVSQDTETVTVTVTSALSNNNLNELYYQYYESSFTERCYSRTDVLVAEDIPANDSFDLTIHCTHSGNFALLEFWVVDETLDIAENDAVIPQCCQAGDDQNLPVTKYLLEIKCITSCPESPA